MLAQLLKNFYICTFLVLVDRQKQEVIGLRRGGTGRDSAHQLLTNRPRLPKFKTATWPLPCGGPVMGCKRGKKKSAPFSTP